MTLDVHFLFHFQILYFAYWKQSKDDFAAGTLKRLSESVGLRLRFRCLKVDFSLFCCTDDRGHVHLLSFFGSHSKAACRRRHMHFTPVFTLSIELSIVKSTLQLVLFSTSIIFLLLSFSLAHFFPSFRPCHHHQSAESTSRTQPHPLSIVCLFSVHSASFFF